LRTQRLLQLLNLHRHDCANPRHRGRVSSAFWLLAKASCCDQGHI
jgi:hypothetical protein